jgi:hypothetical protein
MSLNASYPQVNAGRQKESRMDREKFWRGLGAKKCRDGFWRIGIIMVGCVADDPVFTDPHCDDVPLEALLDGLEKLDNKAHFYYDPDRQIYRVSTSVYAFPLHAQTLLGEGTGRRSAIIAAIKKLLEATNAAS